MNQKTFMSRLKKQLSTEFQTQERSGIYGLMQRDMAYNSNKIEGSRLTPKQTASIFETGTVISSEENMHMQTRDIEETTGHFKMFNQMLKHFNEPLSHDLIKSFHKNLKEGVFYDLLNGYAVGDYKKRKNFVSDLTTAEPVDVPAKMEVLIQDFNAKTEVTIKDLAKLHADFEYIHPFQDGNGRVGRLLLVKECLKNDITPIIIHDENKLEYQEALHKAQTEDKFDDLVKFFEKEQQAFQKNTMSMIFDYDELAREKEYQENSIDKLESKNMPMDEEVELARQYEIFKRIRKG